MADTFDAKREQVVRELTRHCGEGRLTLDELGDRIEEAYAATTIAELRTVLRDLPGSWLPEPDAEPVPEPAWERPKVEHSAWSPCSFGRGNVPVPLIVMGVLFALTFKLGLLFVILMVAGVKHLARASSRSSARRDERHLYGVH